MHSPARGSEHAPQTARPTRPPGVPAIPVVPVDAAAEQEAIRIAARLLAGADATGRPSAPVPPGAGGGKPLPGEMQRQFGGRFRRDLSAVRVHADARAGDAAGAVGARAFAFGSDIVFARGEYAPATAAGRALLAHELVHVLQQSPAAATASPLEPQQRVAPRSAILRAAPVVGGAIEVVAGLAQTASFASDLHSQSLGGLSYTSSVAQRISDQPKPAAHHWEASCLLLNVASRDYASAAFNVLWEGNDYGEIGSARVRVSLPHTTAFTHSSATVAFEALPNLIQPGGDKRTWQMAWEYEGSFDLGGPGYLMFQGGFAIDAFGNFRPTGHVVVDRSTMPPQPLGFVLAPVLDPRDLVVPGPAVERPVPPPPR